VTPGPRTRRRGRGLAAWPSLATALVGAVLTGCGAAPPAPADRYYRLVPVQAQEVVARQWSSAAIEIQELRAGGPYLDRPIVFTDPAQPTRLEQYNYHHWLYAPPYLIQQHMVQWFRASRLAAAIADDDSGPPPDFVISGRIVRFEEALAATGPRAEVELELKVTRPGQAAPLLSKTYSGTQAAASDSMDAFVVAMGQALEQIYAAFSKDLMALEAAQSPGRLGVSVTMSARTFTPALMRVRAES
jgi:ABC-type uncharacterized transport system auxiliary subunit